MKVAIIGPSGSGKSTLLQVMLGLYHVDQGTVKLKHQIVTDINEEDKYYKMNGMLQSQHIFDGTVRDNLFSEKEDAILKQSSSICRTWVPGSRKKCNIRWKRFIWWRKTVELS